ncbi:MAG: RNA polymerase sigma factor [Spirosomataceae bacterium]
MMENDKQIIDWILNPNERDRGFRALVKSYSKRIYWHVRKMVIIHEDADDLVQEIFVKIWQNLDKFRGDSKLYTWIYRITTNETLTFLQRKRRQLTESIDDNSFLLDSVNQSIQQGDMSGTDIELLLQKALLNLTDKQRQIFQMKYFEHLTFEEISEITGTTVGGLKATYHTAMKKVEEFVEGH